MFYVKIEKYTGVLYLSKNFCIFVREPVNHSKTTVFECCKPEICKPPKKSVILMFSWNSGSIYSNYKILAKHQNRFDNFQIYY